MKQTQNLSSKIIFLAESELAIRKSVTELLNLQLESATNDALFSCNFKQTSSYQFPRLHEQQFLMAHGQTPFDFSE